MPIDDLRQVCPVIGSLICVWGKKKKKVLKRTINYFPSFILVLLRYIFRERRNSAFLVSLIMMAAIDVMSVTEGKSLPLPNFSLPLLLSIRAFSGT